MPPRSRSPRPDRPRAAWRASWVRQAGIAVLLVLAGIAAYANSFAGALVFDDTPAIVDNPNLRRLWPLTASMSAPPEVTVSGRPVASLTFALNYALAPADVRAALRAPTPFDPPDVELRYRRNLWGYHLGNLLIHLGAGLVLFGVVRRTLLTPRLIAAFGDAADGLAAAVALLWLVHPLQTESVTYVVQRVESLMGLFYLLTMYAAIRASASTRPVVWAAGAVAACALGMGSKEVMVSAPLMVVAWDWLFSSPATEPSRWRWRLYLALAATWVILAALVYVERRPHSVGAGLHGWSAWSYLVAQAGVILHYLRLVAVPAPLVIDYDWPRGTSFLASAPAFVTVATMAMATVAGLFRRRPQAFLGLWFFLILAPTSSVLPIATEVAAEHRMYLPLAAVVAGVILGIHQIVARVRPLHSHVWRRAGWIALALAVVSLGFLTWTRNDDYRTEEALWRDTVAKRPSNVRARVAYGKSLFLARRFPEAEDELRRALRVDDSDAIGHLNLGATLAAQRKFPEGIRHFERALALDARLVEADANLGEAYAAVGDHGHAVVYLGRALDRQPENVFLLNRLSWLLATSPADRVREGERAKELANRAVRLTNEQDPESLDSLAVSAAELDQFDQAVRAGALAVARARILARHDYLPELESRLARYRAGQKFRTADGGR